MIYNLTGQQGLKEHDDYYYKTKKKQIFNTYKDTEYFLKFNAFNTYFKLLITIEKSDGNYDIFKLLDGDDLVLRLNVYKDSFYINKTPLEYFTVMNNNYEQLKNMHVSTNKGNEKSVNEFESIINYISNNNCVDFINSQMNTIDYLDSKIDDSFISVKEFINSSKKNINYKIKILNGIKNA